MKVDEELEADIQSFTQVGLPRVCAVELLEAINSRPLYKNDRLQFIKVLRQVIYKGFVSHEDLYKLVEHYLFITNVKYLSDRIKERGSISSNLLVASIVLADYEEK